MHVPCSNYNLKLACAQAYKPEVDGGIVPLCCHLTVSIR